MTAQPIFVLGIDTCGPTGSVALGQLSAGQVELLGQVELEGRTYSSTLFQAIRALLSEQNLHVADLGCIVAVNGPGSFTGVRVGLSAVKGLAEAVPVPVLAVSRLEILARKACLTNSAIDAHRHEIFLRLDDGAEQLVSSTDLALFAQQPRQIAVCDNAGEALLREAWPLADLLRTAAPTAADALSFTVDRIEAQDFQDLALLDGHYLRRSDAEIFGDPQPASQATENR